MIIPPDGGLYLVRPLAEAPRMWRAWLAASLACTSPDVPGAIDPAALDGAVGYEYFSRRAVLAILAACGEVATQNLGSGGSCILQAGPSMIIRPGLLRIDWGSGRSGCALDIGTYDVWLHVGVWSEEYLLDPDACASAARRASAARESLSSWCENDR